MASERTLSIVKPDAVAKNIIGEIYSRFEKGGLKIVAARMQRLSRAKAEGFYAEHKRSSVLREPRHLYDVGPGRHSGSRRRERHCRQPQVDGGDQSEGCGSRDDPSRLRRVDRCECSAWFRFAQSAAREISYFFGADEICPRG